jgi:hypothetical protein
MIFSDFFSAQARTHFSVSYFIKTIYQPILSQINKEAKLCHYELQKNDSITDTGVIASSSEHTSTHG